MRRILICLFVPLLCFFACSPAPAGEYLNTVAGCYLGDVYVENLYFRIWSPGVGAWGMSLCTDPLCTHDSEDGLCPASTWLWMKTVVSDGRRFYLSAANPTLTDKNGTLYRQIFSMDPDGSNFTLLHTYAFSANSSSYLQYADGYLYFEQGFYPDGDSYGLQQAYIMRIPVEGGRAERVFPEPMDVGSVFFADGDHNFLFCPDESGELRMRIIHRESGTVTEDAAAGVKGRLTEITVYGGNTYLQTAEAVTVLCPAETGDEHEYRETLRHLYVLRDGVWVPVWEGAEEYTFGDGIWFCRNERSYLGTKNVPNGGPGGATDAVDFYVNATRTVCRIDPQDHSITEYLPGEGFSPEDTLTIRAAAGDCLWVEVTNGRAEYVGETSAYRCRACSENGELIFYRMDE